MRAMRALDHADMSAHITRQTRMGCWMNVLRAHAIAGIEPRRGGCGSTERAALQNALHGGHREHAAGQSRAGIQRAASRYLVGFNETALSEHSLEAEKPSLVIGACQVDR